MQFAPKTFDWVQFTATGVKSGSQNIGLSEFAVFSPGPQMTLTGGAGNDTLVLDSTAGPLVESISYDGGLGINILTLQGGTATSDVFNAGSGTGQGTSTLTFANGLQSIAVSNVATVLDLVAGPLAVNGTTAADTINYLQGSSAGNGKVAINSAAALEFSNKTTLAINGGTGSDTISLNNPTTPTGLTSVTINASALTNHSPTLNSISDPGQIAINAGLQVVALAGIGDGDGGAQALQVSAISDNTCLIPNPTVSYTSPASTGSIAYTPVANRIGTARITVTVRDAGFDGIWGNSDDAALSRTFTVVVDGPGVSGAVLWLDASTLNLANGAAVTTLADLSGNGNNAVAGNYGATGTVTYRAGAQNGKGVIHFDDFGNLTTANNLGISGDTSRSVFVVMRRNSGTYTRMGFWTGVPWNRTFGLESGGGLVFARWWDGVDIMYAQRPADTFELYDVTHDSATHDSIVYSNGAALGTTTSTLNTTDGPVIIGSHTPLYGFCHENGDFAEALVYNRLLSDAERQQVEAYLNAKWLAAGAGPSTATIPNQSHLSSITSDSSSDADTLIVVGRPGFTDAATATATSNNAGMVNWNATGVPNVVFSSVKAITLAGQSGELDAYHIGGTNFGRGMESVTLGGATLQLAAGHVLASTIDVDVAGEGSLDLAGLTVTVGNVTLSSGSILNGTLIASTQTVRSGVVGATLQGTAGLTKSGSGVVTLSAPNTYTGDTVVNAGQLVVANAAALPATTTLVVAGEGTVVLGSSLTKAARLKRLVMVISAAASSTTAAEAIVAQRESTVVMTSDIAASAANDTTSASLLPGLQIRDPGVSLWSRPLASNGPIWQWQPQLGASPLKNRTDGTAPTIAIQASNRSITPAACGAAFASVCPRTMAIGPAPLPAAHDAAIMLVLDYPTGQLPDQGPSKPRPFSELRSNDYDAFRRSGAGCRWI